MVYILINGEKYRVVKENGSERVLKCNFGIMHIMHLKHIKAW